MEYFLWPGNTIKNLKARLKQLKEMNILPHRQRIIQEQIDYMESGDGDFVKPTPLTNKEKERKKHILKTYKMSMDKYEKMREEQDYRCAICGNVFKNRKDTHIDHDHQTGNLRDLLCCKCNLGLGYFKDNIDILQRAIKYLEKHK